MLKKEVCVRCCNESAKESGELELGWDVHDEQEWKHGTVMCPTKHCWPKEGMQHEQVQNIDQIPVFCPNAEEHKGPRDAKVDIEKVKEIGTFIHKQDKLIRHIRLEIVLDKESDPEHLAILSLHSGTANGMAKLGELRLPRDAGILMSEVKFPTTVFHPLAVVAWGEVIMEYLNKVTVEE